MCDIYAVMHVSLQGHTPNSAFSPFYTGNTSVGMKKKKMLEQTLMLYQMLVPGGESRGYGSLGHRKAYPGIYYMTSDEAKRDYYASLRSLETLTPAANI